MIGNERICGQGVCLEGRRLGGGRKRDFSSLLVLTQTHHIISPSSDGHTDYWHLGINKHTHMHMFYVCLLLCMYDMTKRQRIFFKDTETET